MVVPRFTTRALVRIKVVKIKSGGHIKPGSKIVSFDDKYNGEITIELRHEISNNLTFDKCRLGWASAASF